LDGLVNEDDKWTLSLDVPGVAKEHLDVSVSGNRVLVQTTGEAKRQYRFAYELAGEIDADATEAQLADGVLTLRLGKAEARTRRQITIA
jgi:HSP20 family molecular chaperone IbpA